MSEDKNYKPGQSRSLFKSLFGRGELDTVDGYKRALEAASIFAENQKLIEQAKLNQSTVSIGVDQGSYGVTRTDSFGTSVYKPYVTGAGSGWKTIGNSITSTPSAGELLAAIKTLQRENEALQRKNAELERIMKHPDRVAITSVEGLLDRVSGEEVFRATSPVDFASVWNAVRDSVSGLKRTVMTRGGLDLNVTITGIGVIVSNPVGPRTAHYLSGESMDEMHAKQIITDLIGGIIEDRVLEEIENGN